MKSPDKSTIIVTAAIIAILAGIGVYSHREQLFARGKKVEAPQSAIVKTERVSSSSSISDRIVQNMSVDAKDRVQLLPRVTGRLLALRVGQGQSVRAGEVIAELEHEQQNAQILSTAAQAASARADTERARAELQNAKTNLERYRRLQNEGFSTQQQLDQMQTEFTSAEASVRAALAKERQYAAETRRVGSAKEDYIIRSPMNGTVLNDYSLTAGAMISPSSPILDIADLRMLKATLRIPESKIFAVKKGMTVILDFDALPGKTFSGAVTRIDQYVDPETRTSSVEIEIDNGKQAGGVLRPGMFGRASIVEREYKNALTIPEGALHSAEKGFYVYVAEDGKARMRKVETGITDGGRVLIKSGLKAGDEVITFGGSNLNDGDTVSAEK